MRKLIGYIVGTEVFCPDHVPEGVDLEDEDQAVPLYDADDWVHPDACCSVCYETLQDEL